MIEVLLTWPSRGSDVEHKLAHSLAHKRGVRGEYMKSLTALATCTSLEQIPELLAISENREKVN